MMETEALVKLMGAMTCMECGIAPNEVDTAAIAQGYRLAFPENADKLNEWLLGADEYRYW